jgi:hypothetical protein
MFKRKENVINSNVYTLEFRSMSHVSAITLNITKKDKQVCREIEFPRKRGGKNTSSLSGMDVGVCAGYNIRESLMS